VCKKKIEQWAVNRTIHVVTVDFWLSDLKSTMKLDSTREKIIDTADTAGAVQAQEIERRQTQEIEHFLFYM